MNLRVSSMYLNTARFMFLFKMCTSFFEEKIFVMMLILLLCLCDYSIYYLNVKLRINAYVYLQCSK